ncbi:MAG: hypothetical protein JSU57_06285 [Candidatus Heimdallarchaeota archaeon]|nr:MAG: hypothetical protein JSU57_06285 [Candidatus Heimdallarchaeota archaeon]
MALENLFRSLVLTSFLFIGFLLVFSPSLVSTSRAIEVTPDTKVEMYDVVRVNYTLWIENDIVDDQEGTIYVEDPEIIDKEGVPNTIIEEFPNVYAPPNLGFVEGLLGMKAGDEKSWQVLFSSGKAFNNDTDPYHREDLFYIIRLKKILLDASKPPTTLFDIPIFMPLVFLISLVILLLIILRIQRYSRTHDLFRLKKKCLSCRNIADVMCGNPGCNTPYCKKCFLEKNGCEVCHSNTMVPIN